MAGLARRAARRIRRSPLLRPGRSSGADRSANTAAAAPTPVSNGLVEIFERRQIVGWVEVPKGADPTRVGLYLNDTQVTGAWAIEGSTRRGTGEIRHFRFPLYDFWRFAKTTDRVTVRVDDRPLPINGRGTFYYPRNDGASDLAELARLQREGHVFADTGRLQLSKTMDTAWQATVTGLYGELRAELREFRGIEPFLVYGSLLGAVREGTFIGHDHDFDSAFLSTRTDPREAAKELQEIGLFLVDRGYRVRGQYSAIHVFDKATDKTRIDLFHLYFDEAGLLQFPFGVAGHDDVKKSDWTGLHEIDFGGSRVLVPDNAEAVVAHIYGASWRTPNPGFDWNRDRTRRSAAGLLKAPQIDEIYWANFYAHNQFDAGSTFCQLVDGRAETPRAVVDLGCGDGRDSFAFAMSGRTVTGLDRSAVAVERAARKSRELGFGQTLTFATCDVGDAEALRAVLTRARTGDEPLLFYARFFLHALTEDAQQTLMRTVGECARPGDYFAAEFRTDRDADATKAYGEHFRRFQDGPAFGRALADGFGFELLVEQEGTGLSILKDEDPHLYRVIARRPAAEATG